jgi:hypothetical protein
MGVQLPRRSTLLTIIMYKIIGGDGNEYGPVSAEHIKAWIADGRASAQTQVQAEGQTEWKALADHPELAALLGTAAPPGPPPAFAPGVPYASAPDALQQVQGPAIGLIVTAILGILYQILNIILTALGVTMNAFQQGQAGGQEMPAWIQTMSGGVGIAFGILGIVLGVVVLLGALKMKKLENYTFSVIATVIAMVPCISPCCLVGLPIGIWALVVLNKPEVKGSFH